MTTLSDDLGTEGRRLVGAARANRPFESYNAVDTTWQGTAACRMLAARQRDETEAAMRRFLAKHAATTGHAVVLRPAAVQGHLPLGYRRYGRVAGLVDAAAHTNRRASSSYFL